MDNPSDFRLPSALPVTADGPDLLGIDRVSGFYGPGSWAAFFLMQVGSWASMRLEPDDLRNANTWGYLLYLDWASADLIIQIIGLRRNFLHGAQPEELLSQMGVVGAPILVVWWGTLNALCQVAAAWRIPKAKTRIRTIATLCFFLLLPAGALFAIFWINDVQIGDQSAAAFVPALYWHEVSLARVYLNMTAFVATGIWLLVYLAYTTSIITGGSQFLPRIAVPYAAICSGALLIVSSICIVFFCLVLANVDGVVIAGTTMSAIFIPFGLLGMYMWFWSWPYLIIGSVAANLMSYLPYITSKSCFVLPCTSSKLADMDQAFALFATLFVMVVLEGFLPYLTKLRRTRRQHLAKQVMTRLRTAQRHGVTDPAEVGPLLDRLVSN